MKVSDAITAIIAQKGKNITQKDIGEALGVSKQYVGQIKEKPLTDEQIKKLENAFQVNFTIVNKKQSDCINIPVRAGVHASMGYGVTVYDEKPTGTYAVSRKLANDLGISLNASEIIFASGDSMLPTIEGGDSLLVDLNKKEIYDGKIYCVRIDGQLYAKRLQKIPPSTVKVISDNSNKYDPFYVDFSKTIDYDFEVIGEIRWWGRVAR